MASIKAALQDLDPYEKPPESLRLLFKKLQKSSVSEEDADILDFSAGQANHGESVRTVGAMEAQDIRSVFNQFIDASEIADSFPTSERTTVRDSLIFEATDVPGLMIFPSLLSSEVQLVLLHKMLHRDLSNPTHQTNLHLHYQVPYVGSNTSSEGLSGNLSFFSMPPETIFVPKDRAVHKDLTLRSVLSKKLRWITLGGQYDWTAKEYPDEPPPAFPTDIQKFLQLLFPETISQAAIVNFYSSGNVLSLHRDVAEQCDHGLISISIGCDGLFLVGLDSEDGPKSVTVKLRSGDVVYMTGQARSAWHGVPKVLAGTCPKWLKDWPVVDESDFRECWHGWMSTKRINVNIRQMYPNRQVFGCP